MRLLLPTGQIMRIHAASGVVEVSGPVAVDIFDAPPAPAPEPSPSPAPTTAPTTAPPTPPAPSKPMAAPSVVVRTSPLGDDGKPTSPSYLYPYLCSWRQTFHIAVPSKVCYHTPDGTRYVVRDLTLGRYEAVNETFGVSDFPPGSGCVLMATDGSVAPMAYPGPDSAPDSTARPYRVPGHGFFVAYGALYAPAGKKFVPWGLNQNNFDAANGNEFIAASGANVQRWNAQNEHIGAIHYPLERLINHQRDIVRRGVVPMPACWLATGGDDVAMRATLNLWIAQSSAWCEFNDGMLLNPINEGGTDAAKWRDVWVEFMPLLRAAGYTCPIVVDAPRWGEDWQALRDYAPDILMADPHRNVAFSFHAYGSFQPGAVEPAIHALRAAHPMLTFLVGEFGPGRGLAPNPTWTSPVEVMQAAATHHIGCLAWADWVPEADWRMREGEGGAQTLTRTAYGRQVIEHPQLGLQVYAKRPVMVAPTPPMPTPTAPVEPVEMQIKRGLKQGFKGIRAAGKRTPS